MNNMEKVAISIYHTEIFSKSGIPIYNSEVIDTAARKKNNERIQAIAKRSLFYSNAIPQTVLH